MIWVVGTPASGTPDITNMLVVGGLESCGNQEGHVEETDPPDDATRTVQGFHVRRVGDKLSSSGPPAAAIVTSRPADEIEPVWDEKFPSPPSPPYEERFANLATGRQSLADLDVPILDVDYDTLMSDWGGTAAAIATFLTPIVGELDKTAMIVPPAG